MEVLIITITIDEIISFIDCGAENVAIEIKTAIDNAMIDCDVDVCLLVEMLFVAISHETHYGRDIYKALKNDFPRGNWRCYAQDGADIGTFIVTYENYKRALNEYWRVRLGM